MNEFDVNQNISMNVEPAVIEPLNYEFTTNYASVVRPEAPWAYR